MHKVNDNVSDEISFKDFLVKFYNWLLFFKNKWAIIFSFSLFGALVSFLFAHFHKFYILELFLHLIFFLSKVK